LSLGKLGSVSGARSIYRPKSVALRSLVEDRVSVDREEGRGALLVTLVILQRGLQANLTLLVQTTLLASRLYIR
jgi:hypothetical protein